MGVENKYIKIALLGESFVGKTSVLHKYIYESFDNIICTTISPDFKVKLVGESKLQIWDLPGLERFRQLIRGYLKIADVSVIMFDVTEHESFEQIEAWLKELLVGGSDNAKLYLVANKIDSAAREVSREEADGIARKYGMKYFECSAKTGEGLSQLFQDIAFSCADMI